MCIKQQVVTSQYSKPRPCLGVRHVQVGMLFLSLVISCAMRSSFSMAVVAMTDKDLENTFEWSMQTQSVILSSFFWGYAILQVPAGEMAARFGGTMLVTVSVTVNSVMSLMVPVAAQYGNWQAVCACRVVQGLFQGFLLPAIHTLIGQWIPMEERSSLATFIYAGNQLGTSLQLMVSGFIADSWGWPAIFYSNAALGIIWVLPYLLLGADTPQHSRVISEEERHYIQTSLGHLENKKKLKTPWLAIMTSLPFISVIIAHSVQVWGYYTLMTEMPSYLKQVLGVDIKSNGLMSAIPYLTMYVLSFPFGFCADYLIKKEYLSVTATRKLSNSIGHYGPALALLGLSYSPAGNAVAAVILLTVVVGLNAGHLTGFMLVHIEMAPNFAGTLMGVTNAVGSCVSILAPLAAGAIIADETDPVEWRTVFHLATAIYVIGNTLFIMFATSELQTWNDLASTAYKISDTNETSPSSKAEKVI